MKYSMEKLIPLQIQVRAEMETMIAELEEGKTHEKISERRDKEMWEYYVALYYGVLDISN